MRRLFLSTVIALSIFLVGTLYTVQAQAPKDYPPITGYYSPCKGGTAASIFSWHGVNQDGKPPVDLNRRSVDFLCVGKQVYAPYHGVVYGTTESWGGLILIDDAEHNGCIVFLGMLTFEVKSGQTVKMGDVLGIYNYHIHIAVTDGTCERAKWYNRASRALERPVLWTEMGKVIPSDILQADALPFVSQNPAR